MKYEEFLKQVVVNTPIDKDRVGFISLKRLYEDLNVQALGPEAVDNIRTAFIAGAHYETNRVINLIGCCRTPREVDEEVRREWVMPESTVSGS